MHREKMVWFPLSKCIESSCKLPWNGSEHMHKLCTHLITCTNGQSCLCAGCTVWNLMIIVEKWINCPGINCRTRRRGRRALTVLCFITQTVLFVKVILSISATTSRDVYLWHKHNNKLVSCAYRLWECQDSLDSFFFYRVFVMCCFGTGPYRTF